MPFLKARAFARKLGFKSVKQWQAWARSKRRPKNIPSSPYDIYANDGWKGWSDFLGTGGRRAGGWRSFKETKAFIRKLGLTFASPDEWVAFVKSDKCPDDIPRSPHQIYAHEWKSWPNFFGRADRRGGAQRKKRKKLDPGYSSVPHTERALDGFARIARARGRAGIETRPG
jgi:hypothetical protein